MIQQQANAYAYYPPYAPAPGPTVPMAPPAPMAPAPMGPVGAVPVPAPSYGQMLDHMHFLSTQLPAAPVAPAPLPAPSIVNRLSKLVDRLTKPKRQPSAPPAPPPPKPEPKAEEPKPRPKPPKPPAPKAPPADTARYFHAQYRSASNTNEDAPSNGNCGPASLTMIAEAFKKIKVTPSTANGAIEATRRRMGAGTSQSDEYDGTSYEQLVRGAKSYGLDANVYYGGIDILRRELAKGRLIIAHVRPSYLFPGTTSGHYAVVTKVAGGKVYMNDPANPKGQTVLSEATFLRAQKERGAYGLVSIGP